MNLFESHNLFIVIFLLILIALSGGYYIYRNNLYLINSEMTWKDQRQQEQQGGNLQFKLNEEFNLSKNEIAYYPTVNNWQFMLQITDFTNEPCSEGAYCIWSGQMVHFKLVFDENTYSSPGNIQEAPYEVLIKDSDYQNYARFIVRAK